MVMAGNEDSDYKCNLSTETQAIAKEELREDETTRQHALEQLRQWILKHPTIKHCRMDAAFLLRFLRTKKFSLPLAQEMLERYLTIRQIYPYWFHNLDIEDPDIEAIIDSGYVVVLPERDLHGRKVMLICTGFFDPYKYTREHMVRTHSLVVEALMDDEESQVRGYTYIANEAGLTMGHLSIWSMVDLRNLLRCIQNNTPMRHKETHITSLPLYASKFIEFIVSLLNDKLKARIFVHKEMQDLKDVIDIKTLPKEFGGEIPLSDMILSLKQLLREKRDIIKGLDDMYIEISQKEYQQSKCNDSLESVPGSFRKLEVD